MTLSGTLDQRDAGGRAAHVGKADDDFEITQLEHAAADDEHIVVPPSGGNRPGDPGPIATDRFVI